MKENLNQIIGLNNLELTTKYLSCISRIERMIKEEKLCEEMNNELLNLIELNCNEIEKEEKKGFINSSFINDNVFNPSSIDSSITNYNFINEDIGKIINELFNIEEKQMICSICLSGGSNIVFKCGHFFHNECSSIWLQENNTCPNCRKKIT